MDLITRAMDKKLHICQDTNLMQQTWEVFHKQSKGKKIFLFGTGGGMAYFFRYCCKHIKIAGIIDNNKEKQNHKLGWYSPEVFQTEYENIFVKSPDILKNYDSQDTIILITSVDYYLPMVEQLKQMMYTNYFVLLMMEANHRKDYPNEIKKDFFDIREEYINWCCQQILVNNKIVMRIGEYGGHAKCITNQLLKSGEDLDIVWLVHNMDIESPSGVRLVLEKNWKQYIYEMETCKIWLFDVNPLEFIRKRKNQIYIQCKHWSSITLKTFTLDDASTCTSAKIIERFKKDGERMDYILSGSEFDEKSCQSGLGFRGKAVRVGSARSDILFDMSVKEKVFEHFHLKPDIHVLLYSPTYRDKEFKENHKMTISLDMKGLLDTLEKKWGGDWVLFIRLHPWLDFKDCGLKETHNIINAGNYPESEELVAASDVMVTDYSSIMFEEAFLKRPVFLYAPDRNEYIDKERGLLLKYDELPFPIAESNESLRQCILQFDEDEYKEKLTDFLNYHGICEDGHASERAARFIIELLKGISI